MPFAKKPNLRQKQELLFGETAYIKSKFTLFCQELLCFFALGFWESVAETQSSHVSPRHQSVTWPVFSPGLSLYVCTFLEAPGNAGKV